MKKELIKSLKKYKWQILIEIILIVISVIFIAYPSKIVGKMIDLLYNAESNKSEIIKSIVQLLSISIGFLITRVLWKNLDFRINIYIDKDLKDRLFTKLLKTKVKALNEIKNGEIMSYFVSDLRKVTMITAKFISTGTRIIANFTIAIIMMSNSCNIKLTLISLIPVLITIVVIIFIRKRWMDVMKEAQKSFADLSEYVQESTDSIRTMKAFCGEDKQIEEFKDKNATLKKYNISVSKNQNLLFVCVSLGFGLAYAITLLYGSNLVINGKVSIGNLIAFNGYLAMLEGPVRWIPWLFGKAKKFKVSFDRLNKMFKLPEEEIDNFEKSNEDKLNGDIEIKNLTYNYPGYIETVLENINIDIKKGESLGIIGVIGSGKTTLMNLLLKLYDVERGKIFIDGKDINDIPVKIIRDNICYITQDNFLFSATLKENINLFKDEYKDEDIEDSTKQAMIYDEISHMDDGINTVIGEKGIDLSGGQKQRDCTPPGSCRLMTRSRQKSRKSIRGGLAAGCWLSRFRSILRFPECGQVIAASISSFCRRLNHSTSSFEKCVQTHNA